jgi:VIT1/CCC1 family predicted Fe2+/Mn2+ transporter
MKHSVSREQLLDAQRNEASEYETYSWLASRVRDESNRAILERIAGEERRHYEVFKRLTGTDVRPRRSSVFWYRTLSRGLGLSFGLRLMERGERLTQSVYARLKEQYPQLADVLLDEQRHETEILGLIEEERIAYAGSVVLGLNDALVELTGALAGLTLALRNGQVIAMTGLITGVAASMSMAASAFLSSREEADRQEGRSPLKSAAYTGAAYITTVVILILPYLLISSVFWALAVMMALSILVILSYNFYIATAKGTPLWRRFGTMAGISLAVAVISFLFGMAARTIFGVDV